jgi:hypothetical protein
VNSASSRTTTPSKDLRIPFSARAGVMSKPSAPLSVISA